MVYSCFESRYLCFGDQVISADNPKLTAWGASWALAGVAFTGVFIANRMSSWLSSAQQPFGANLIEALLAGAVILAASWWIFGRAVPRGAGTVVASARGAWRREQDPLTHAFSQHGITVKLIEYVALAERYNRNLSIVLIEIEKLDEIAAQTGRSTADRVLVQLADAIIEQVRTTDRVGRLDDNRFLLVLPETDGAGARVVEERAREYARCIEIATDSWRRAHITVVTGAASFRRGEDINHLMARAEQALEAVKAGAPADTKAA
jgi:diguanylate cyclase (GGDEF)-like protein